MVECKSRTCKLKDVLEDVAHVHNDLTHVLSRDGALLFRGFPLAAAQDFHDFVEAFDYPNFPYRESLSNAVRINKTDRVFTANEAPSHVSILLHHEMAQTPIFPAKLFFFCEQPAASGGATPLCRSDLLFARLKEERPKFANNCEGKGLKYSNVMPSDDDPESGMGRSWRSTLGADTRDAAEARLQSLGYSWQWLTDGSLRATTPVLPAVHEIAPGRTSFFNQLIAAFQGWRDARNDPSDAVTFGDESRIDRRDVDCAAAFADEVTYDHLWQRGDVVLVDNMAVMHGRRPFEGVRRVLASLAEAREYTFRPY